MAEASTFNIIYQAVTFIDALFQLVSHYLECTFITRIENQ
jgi:hypothetical protein